MFVENVVFDATEPRTLGRFWEAALGTEQLTDDEAGYETRLAVPGGPVLDFCFQRVPEPTTGSQRLHLELHGGPEPAATVERLLALGAGRVVLADPAGNAFSVLTQRADGTASAAADRAGCPVVAMSLAVADPVRDAEFWAWLSGWVPTAGEPTHLEHPSRRGPHLKFVPEREPKRTGKNPIHLDARLEPADDADAVAAEIIARGGREFHPDWGDLPWRLFLDPSGNEFCVLAAPATSTAGTGHEIGM